MSKKKRKPSSRSRKQESAKPSGRAPAAPPPQHPVAALREAIAEMRGRRAVTLLEGLRTTEELNAETLTRLSALTREAQARELIANGHVTEVRQTVCAAAKRQPELVPFLSLGLRVRCGLEPDLEQRLADPDWVLRLRRDLVEPADLAETAEGGLNVQVAAVLEAWRLFDSGGNETVNDRLKSIGRRSPLLDWRLFLHVLMAARTGDAGKADDAFARMLSGCCAQRLASAVITYARTPFAPAASGAALGDPEPRHAIEASIRESLSRSDPVVLLRELAAYLHATGVVAAQDRIVNDARRLYAMGRPGLAVGVLVATLNGLPKRYASGFTRRYSATFPAPWRVTMRSGCHGSPVVTPDEADIAVKKPNLWTPRERAVILVEAARTAREEARHDDSGPIPRSILNVILGGELDDDDEDEDLIVDDVRAWSRLAATLWPELPDSYELWRWADQRNRPHSGQALEARVRSMPDNPEAWEALAVFATEQLDRPLFDKAEARLRDFPGMTQRCEALRDRFRFGVVSAAFQAGDTAAVQAEAASFTGQNPVQRVAVAVMDWLMRADRSSKREAGTKLAQLGHPWLVMKTAFELRSGLSLAALPLPLRKAFEDDSVHASVLGDFVLALGEPARLSKLRKDLTRMLARALGAEAPPLSLGADAAFGVFAYVGFFNLHACGEDTINRGLWDLSARMIHDAEPGHQARGLMLRAMWLDFGRRSYAGRVIDHAQTLLLAAASHLAVSTEARHQLRRAIERCVLSRDQVDLHASRLSRADVDALLQGQRESATADEMIARLMPSRPDHRRPDRPRGRRPRRNAPVGIPRTPPPPAFVPTPFDSEFNIDQFFPTTSIEFEMGIASAKNMPPPQRTDTLVRIRALIDASVSLSDARKAQLHQRCANAETNA